MAEPTVAEMMITGQCSPDEALDRGLVRQFLADSVPPRTGAVLAMLDTVAASSVEAAYRMGSHLLSACEAEEPPFDLATFLVRLAEVALVNRDAASAYAYARRASELLLVPEFRESQLRLAALTICAEAARGAEVQPVEHDLQVARTALESTGRVAPDAGLRRKGGLSFTRSGTGPAKWVKASVHYATHRIPTTQKNLDRAFGSDPIGALLYGQAELHVKEDPELAHMREMLGQDDLSLARLARKAGGAAELLRLIDLDPESFWASLHSQAAKHQAPEALIYVHGFNTTFGASLKIAAQLSVALEVRGPTIAYTWPSQGSWMPWDYRRDERTVAALDFDQIADLIGGIVEKSGAERVMLIAHSMGNRPTLEALGKLANRIKPPTRRIQHVIYAAPDVPRSDFAEKARNAANLVVRSTLYCSNRDAALKHAPQFSDTSESRAGCGIPLVLKEIETVDTTDASGDTLGHSDFSGTARDDVRALVWHDAHPDHRDLIAPASCEDGRYYQFRPLKDIQNDLDNCRRAILLARLLGFEKALAELDTRIRRLLVGFRKTRLELLDMRRFVIRVCGRAENIVPV